MRLPAESRGRRGLQLGLVARLAVALLVGWSSDFFLLFRLMRDSIWSSAWSAVLVVLATLCALPTRDMVAAMKGLVAPR